MKLALTIFIACSIIFLLFPELDLITTQYIYDLNNGFLPKKDGIPGIIFHGTELLTASLIIFCCAAFMRLLKHRPPWSVFNAKNTTFILIALALGPGLVVNGVLKNQWGRARPVQVEQFGGTKQFTPPLIITDQCEKNCSFVAGHPSMGFFFLIFAFLYPTYKKEIIASALALGAIIGATRIAQGGHFLSDVIFSALFTYLTIYITQQIINKMWPHTNKT